MGKRIVLCADGTWNTPHGVDVAVNDTNVRKLYCALTDVPEQLSYYDSGVGTNGTPIDHLIGGAMGEGLFQKIQENYQYLAYVWTREMTSSCLGLAEEPIRRGAWVG
jgi:uncharacterized protein (DUF2235 family)